MDYYKLSKEVSYALRHAPSEYALELDSNGWVSIEQLLGSLRTKKKWRDLKENELRVMINNADKKRFEIRDGKIRALYGHSTPHKIQKEAKEPPEVLYHGTARHLISEIKEKGLLPKGRQYVHLSADVDTACQVGRRRDAKPVILKVKAKLAWQDGIGFYQGNDKVWLSDSIASKYIEFE